MAKIEITQSESIFLQALASTSLICQLSNSDFLNSDYFKERDFFKGNKILESVINKSSIGNPAMLQMFLYGLLVVPREILGNNDAAFFEKCRKEINSLCVDLVERETYSTYVKDKNGINYYRHIRNSISHSKCEYKSVNEVTYVTFKDKKNLTEKCDIVLKTEKVGEILNKLQKLLMEYLKEKFDKRK